MRLIISTIIENLPLEKVEYIHMAGHEQVAPDLIIDTHGEPIIDPVYELFDFTVRKLPNTVPVLLERDFNIPELKELQYEKPTYIVNEVNELKKILI